MVGVNPAITAPARAYQLLAHDYTCTRCGETVNGIPYGPRTEEWCVRCWFELPPVKPTVGTVAADIQTLLDKHDAAHFDFPVTTLDDAIRAVKAKIQSLEDEAEDLRDEARHAERKADELNDLRIALEKLHA
jgi:hypothetical protein